MTTPRYPQGCAAGSQEHGIAASPAAYSPADYAWNVNFNNGNANWNDRDNNGFVRAVRASECQGAVAFRDLYAAWRDARRGKKPSANQVTFETRWLDGLLELEERLNTDTWRPAPPTCFVAKAPKAREIHAPDFADRIVHHWLVPQLDRIFEPTFIFDSFSNRKAKGTHAAVTRLRRFVRQTLNQGGGWYLQLDVANFFNSIHRPTLWKILRRQMQRHQLPDVVQRATHALLRRSPFHYGVHYACAPAERARVPAHKRLENAAPGCGIAIGNLSSQFFANVYLDRLDQFVKHALGVRRYVRYVDDFVLVHPSREQLEAWRTAIEIFLAEQLRLGLKDRGKLLPLSSGIDFLGYVVHATHLNVRRRVVAHARAKLKAWERRYVRGHCLVAPPVRLREIRSTWSSYAGHFRHADTHRLRCSFERRFPWLPAALATGPFSAHLEGRCLSIPIKEDEP